MPFRFNGLKAHLMYKTHISLDEFKEKILKKLPPMKLWSFVHENGDENEENPTPYEHTQVFIWAKTKMDTVDPRYFDINDVHERVSPPSPCHYLPTSYHRPSSSFLHRRSSISSLRFATLLFNRLSSTLGLKRDIY